MLKRLSIIIIFSGYSIFNFSQSLHKHPSKKFLKHKHHALKSINTYRLDSSYRFNWVNSGWNLDSKTEYVYNTTNDEIGFLTSKYQNKKFVYSSKSSFEIDLINGLDTVDLDYEWDTITKKWNSIKKLEYKYCKDLTTIDNDSLEIDFDWDKNANVWKPNSKYNFLYDQFGLDSVDIFYTWQNNTWAETNRYFTYQQLFTVNGDDSLTIYEKLISSKKVFSDKKEYFYNPNLELTEEVISLWDISKKKWVYDSKIVYSYDQNSNEIERIYYTYNATNSSWVNNYKIAKYYSQHTASVVNLKADNIHLYPNPSTDKVFITNASQLNYKIFTMEGKLMDMGEIYSDNYPLNLDNYSSKGTLFLQLYSNNNPLKSFTISKE